MVQLQVKKVTSPRPMPSLSRKSRSRSRSPLQNKDYDEISIEDMMDDEFEKEEENLKNAEDLAKMQQNVIQLDVGGYKFKTTSDTLTKISGKLSKIVDLKSTAGNAPIFVDRDPKYFGFILNFLRNGGTLDVRTLPDEKHALASILVDSDFYELSNIIRKILGQCRCQREVI